MDQVSNNTRDHQIISMSERVCSLGEQLFTIFLAFVISLAYVASLYIHPLGRRLIAFPERSRDDPVEIKIRFLKVFCASLVSFVTCIIFQSRLSECRSSDGTLLFSCLFANMGIRKINLWTTILQPVLQTLVLFAGPVTGDYFFGRWRGYNRAFFSLLYYNLHFRRRIFRDSIYSLHWWRAYIVAPLSEEFVYRSCLIPVVRFCYGISASIFLSPLAFGVAHLHHIFDRVRLGASVKSAILTTAFQIVYTSIFGVYSAFLFVRTGHILAPILVHALCNYLGVPDFIGFRHLTFWKRAVIFTNYFGGLVLWIMLLRPFSTYGISDCEYFESTF